MLKMFRLAALANVITLGAMGCIPASAADKLDVVASFSVIADFAKNVGGERVAITTLVGPNGDAHVYEPKPADAKAMAGADVILVNGLDFEGFLERLVETSGTKAPVIELTKGVTPIKMKEEFAEEEGGEGEAAHAHEAGQSHEEHAHESGKAEEAGHHHDRGDTDPHAFQSIANARIYVKNIADGFCAADKDGCTTYEKNAAAYTVELDKLETEVKETIASIPAEKRTIITSHDAFGYFENAYDLTFRAPEGISTEADPSAADVARLIEDVRRDKAAAIFVENITNPRLIEQIASETGLKLGGELYSDALSDESGPASTYLAMMRHNIETIKGAVQGN